MPKLINRSMLLIGTGLVGVGKTTYLKKLSQYITNSVYIDKDIINLALLKKDTINLAQIEAEEYSSSHYRENIKSQTYDIMLKIAKDNLQCNKVVILDGYFGDKLDASFLNGYLLSPDFVTKIIYFHCSGNVELERLCKRGYKRDEKRLENFNSYRYSDVREHLIQLSRVSHLVVDTEKDLEENLEKIYEYLTIPKGKSSFIESPLPETLLTEETAMLGVERLSKLLSVEHQNSNVLRFSESVHRTVLKQSLTGLKFQAVPGNGHCLFNSIALYLGQNQDFLRNIIAAHIEDNMEQYRNIVQALNPNRTPEQYLQDLRQGIEWADNLEIAVLMKVLDRPIVVVGSDNRIRNLSNLVGNGDPIFIQYNGHNHYDALILTGEKSPKEILETLTQLTKHFRFLRSCL